MKQIELLGKNKHFFKAFGGTLLKNSHAKSARPTATKHPMHVIIRSSQAKGALSFQRGKKHRQVDQLVRRVCKKHGVRLYEYANVGNHLHLLIKLHKGFLFGEGVYPKLTSSLAMLIVGYGRGKSPSSINGPLESSMDGSELTGLRTMSFLIKWKRWA